MKIAFIVSSLEPGRDGVGDYTRRLAGELIRQGHECQIVALNDRAKTEVRGQGSGVRGQRSDLRPPTSDYFECQLAEGTEVECLRLPSLLGWPERVAMARQWLDAFNPDWVSLQFVPFGFHPKGLPFGFSKRFRMIIGSRKLHIMFHELWVGVSKTSPWRHRMVGLLQKICIRQLAQILKPRMVHTSIRGYQAMLAQINVKSLLLPLFGNIPVANINHDTPLPKEFKSADIFDVKHRSAIYVGLIFGTIHNEWQPQLIVSKLSKWANQQGRKLAMVSIGATGTLGNGIWNQMRLDFPDTFFIKLGCQPVDVISCVLQLADFGISTGSLELAGKSGTVAAMIEHNLPVIAVGDTIHFRFSYDDSSNDFSDFRIASIFDQGFSLKRFLNSNGQKQSVELLSIAKTFLSSIEYDH